MVGIFCSDIHWTEHPPVARGVEDNWLKVQESYVKQLRLLQVQHHMAPIFVAGDLFDKWNSSIYLVNCVLGWLWEMEVYAIPGNHDIPFHNVLELSRSAYWTLVEAGAVKHLTAGGPHCVGNVMVHPFPSGAEVTPPCKDTNSLCTNVALIHDLIWTDKTGYEGASEDKKLTPWLKKLKGYDAAFFGDNHSGFSFVPKEDSQFKTSIFNCGSFMRRHTDERDNKPSVGLLKSDGSVSRHYLSCENDRFADAELVKQFESATGIDLTDFVEELLSNHSEPMLFSNIVLRWLEREKPDDEVRKIMLRCTGGKP